MSGSESFDAKKVSAILRKLAERIESEPDFVDKLFLFLESYGKETQKRKGSKTIEFDIFSEFRKNGVEATSRRLNEMGIDELKAIVAKSSLDTTRKVRKWKTKEKIIDFLVKAVSKQMEFGKSILPE